jgi:ATP-binding protein involved in chromosome partitioning
MEVLKLKQKKLDIPFLGALPLDLSVRIAGDSGTPAALSDGAVAQAYSDLAGGLIASNIA